MALKHKLSIPLMVALLGYPQLNETVYSPALPNVSHDLHILGNAAQTTSSIYFFGFAIGIFIFGILADKLGRRRAMLLGLIVYCIGCLSCALAIDLKFLLLSRFLQALGASSGSVVTLTMIRDVFHENTERSKVLATVSAWLAFAPGLGPFIGGFIVDNFHWRGNFVFLNIIGLILFAISFKYLSETHHQVGQKSQMLRVLLRVFCDKRAMLCAVLIGCYNGMIFISYAELPFIVIDFLGLPPEEYGFFGIIMASGIALGSAWSRRLSYSEKKGEEIIARGCALNFIASSILALLSYHGVIENSDLAIAMLALFLPVFLIFAGFGLIIGVSLSIAIAGYNQHEQGSAGAILGLTYYAVISVCTMGMSQIHDGSIVPMPLYFVFLSICCLWFSHKISSLI